MQNSDDNKKNNEQKAPESSNQSTDTNSDDDSTIQVGQADSNNAASAINSVVGEAASRVRNVINDEADSLDAQFQNDIENRNSLNQQIERGEQSISEIEGQRDLDANNARSNANAEIENNISETRAIVRDNINLAARTGNLPEATIQLGEDLGSGNASLEHARATLSDSAVSQDVIHNTQQINAQIASDSDQLISRINAGAAAEVDAINRSNSAAAQVVDDLSRTGDEIADAINDLDSSATALRVVSGVANGISVACSVGRIASAETREQAIEIAATEGAGVIKGFAFSALGAAAGSRVGAVGGIVGGIAGGALDIATSNTEFYQNANIDLQAQVPNIILGAMESDLKTLERWLANDGKELYVNPHPMIDRVDIIQHDKDDLKIRIEEHKKAIKDQKAYIDKEWSPEKIELKRKIAGFSEDAQKIQSLEKRIRDLQEEIEHSPAAASRRYGSYSAKARLKDLQQSYDEKVEGFSNKYSPEEQAALINEIDRLKKVSCLGFFNSDDSASSNGQNTVAVGGDGVRQEQTESDIADITTQAREQLDNGGNYTIRSGDTLGEIANRYGVSVERLAEANSIENINVIIAGRNLVIPQGVDDSNLADGEADLNQASDQDDSETNNFPSNNEEVSYRIRSGDTLSEIANRYGVSVEELAEANGIENINDIKAGENLIIPQRVDDDSESNQAGDQEAPENSSDANEETLLDSEVQEDEGSGGANNQDEDASGNDPVINVAGQFRESIDLATIAVDDRTRAFDTEGAFDNQGNAIGDGELNEDEFRAVQTATNRQIHGGVVSLHAGFNADDDAMIVSGLLQTVLGFDDMQQDLSLADNNVAQSIFGSRETEVRVEGASQLLSGIISIDQALENDNIIGVLSGGISALSGLDRLVSGGVAGEGIGVLGGLGDIDIPGTGVNLGGALAIANLAMAIDSGEPTAIANAGVQVYTALNPSAAVGPLAYADAIIKLVDGDVEGAVLSAASTYLMTIPVWGWAAAAVLTIFGGELFAETPPDPRASLDFSRDENGDLSFSTESNETGAGLEGQLENSGNAYVQFLGNLEDMYGDALDGGQIDTDALPSLHLHSGLDDEENADYQLRGGRGFEQTTFDLGESPSPEDMARALQDSVLFTHRNDSWLVTREVTDPETGETSMVTYYSPFASQLGPTITQAVAVGPILQRDQQGGFRGLTVANQVETVGAIPVIPTAAQGIQNVHSTVRLNNSIFQGEMGALLAMGLATGEITLAQLAERQADISVEATNLTDNQAYADLIDLFGGEYIVAGSEDSSRIGEAATQPTGFEENDTLSQDISDYYVPRRPEITDLERSGVLVNPDSEDESAPRQQTTSQPVFFGAGIDELGDGSTAGQTDSGSGFIGNFGGSNNGGAGGSGGSGASAGGNNRSASLVDPDINIRNKTEVLEDREVYILASELMAKQPEFTEDWQFVGVTSGTNGTVSVDADGYIRFVPTADYTGAATFTYQVIDHKGKTRDINVDVEVKNTNDRPDAVDDVIAATEDQRVNLSQLLQNDTDIDGNALSLGAVSSVSVGQIVQDADGQIYYQPPANYVGEVLLTYVIRDGQSAANSNATASARLVYAAGENDAPVLQDVTVSGAIEETEFRFSANELLSNAEDPEGDQLQLTNVALVDPTQGTVSIDQNTGEVVFKGADNLHGAVNLSYQVQDSNGNNSQANLTVHVENQIDAITGGNVSINAVEGQSNLFAASVFLSSVDNPGNEELSLTAVRLANGESGVVRLINNGQTVEFIPAPGFTGNTAFEVRVSNGEDRVASQVAVDVQAAPPAAPAAPIAPVVAPAPAANNAGNSGGAANNANASANNNAAPAPAHQPNPEFTLTGGVEDQAFTLSFADILATTGNANLTNIVSLKFADSQQGTIDIDAAAQTVTFTPAADVFGDLNVLMVASDNTGAPTALNGVTQFAGVDDTFAVADVALNSLEDQVLTLDRNDLLADFAAAEFKDIDGEELTIQAVRMADSATGSVAIVNGEVVFTPTNEYAGAAQFEYDVTDGTNTVTATANITIAQVDDAPVAQADVITGAQEETAFSFQASQLLVNDSDPEGTALSVQSVALSDASQGTLSFDSNTGEVSFSPAQNVFGQVAFTYIVSDATGQQSQGSGEISVANTDDGFEVSNHDFRNPIFNILEDEVKTFTQADLLPEYADQQFKDVDQEELLFSNARLVDPTQGSVSIVNSRGVQLTPAQDYFGDIAFEVDVTDGVTTKTIQTTVRVFAENDAPNAQAFSKDVNEDDVLTVDQATLLANVTDAENHSMRVVGVFSQSSGIAEFDQRTGELTYRPEADMNGNSTIKYLVEDEKGAFSVATLNVNVLAQGDGVEAKDDLVQGLEDTAFTLAASDLLANDKDIDGDGINIVSIDTSNIAHGNLTLSADGSQLSYSPEADYSGEQTFTYTIEDADGNQSTATATLNIKEQNDAPEVTRTTANLNEDESITFSSAQLLANAQDKEDDWMSVQGARINSQAGNFGTVNFDEYTGEVTFTPNTNFNTERNGDRVAIDYLVVDEQGAESWATVDLNVAAVNDAPVANDDLVFVWSAGPGGYTNSINTQDLMANELALEVDGDTLSVSSVSTTGTGQVSLNNGVVSYQAAAGQTQDQFTYTLSDGQTNADGTPSQDTATVNVQIVENSAPKAFDFAVNGTEDNVLVFDIADFMNNVQDVDTGNQDLTEVLSIDAVGAAANGSVQVVGNQVHFTPTANFNSANGDIASFNYTVKDVVGNTDSATVSISLAAVNDPVYAVDDRLLNTIDEDSQGLVFNTSLLLQNDTDVDGDAQITSVTVDGSQGTIRSLGNGDFLYTPARNFNGTATVNYTLSDGQNSDTATALITVNPINDPPYIRAIAPVSGQEDQNNQITGLLNRSVAGDIDGDSIRLEVVGTTGGIQASVSGGTINWRDATPGQGSISYRVRDTSNAVSDTVTVRVTTIDVNDPPINISFSGNGRFDHNDLYQFSGIASATDPDGDPITYAATLSVNGVGGNITVIGNRISFSGNGIRPGEGGDFIVSISASDGSSTTPPKDFQFVAGPNGNTSQITRPVVIDLNRNGFNLTAAASAEAVAKFDWDEDGVKEKTGWIAGNGDGVLVFDYDNDNQVTNTDEVSFVDYMEGAKTDLEGLQALDSNKDGVLSKEDADWGSFKLWIDDGDAESEEGELKTLDELGIESISLQSDNNLQDDVEGNIISGESVVTMTDGSTTNAADVAFVYEEEQQEESEETESEEQGDSQPQSNKKDSEPKQQQADEDSQPAQETPLQSAESDDQSDSENTLATETSSDATDSDDQQAEETDESSDSTDSSADEASSDEEASPGSSDQNTETQQSDASSESNQQASDSSDSGDKGSKTEVADQVASDDESSSSESDQTQDGKKSTESSDDDDDLPSDEELDRAAAEASSDAAATSDDTPVAEADSNPESVTVTSTDNDDNDSTSAAGG